LKKVLPMEWWYVIVKGAVQGIAEFLPISSSAHLVLVDVLAQEFGWLSHLSDPYVVEFFDILLHLGTLMAVCVYFKKELRQLAPYILPALTTSAPADASTLTFGNGTRWKPHSLIRGLAITFLVTSVLVVLANKASAVVLKALHLNSATVNDVTQFYQQHPMAVGVNLLILGGLLWFAESKSRTTHVSVDATEPPTNIPATSLTLPMALWIGVAQACAATFRGISRSGSTMATSLLLGLTRAEAATFSFLVSIPIFLAAFVYESIKLVAAGGVPLDSLPWLQLLTGTAVSALVGYIGIAWLMQLIAKHSLKWFALYVWLLGSGLLIYFYLYPYDPLSHGLGC
jgi:undecaprenyl-diphosphatase